MKLCISNMIKIIIFAFLFNQSLALECFSCSSQLDLKNGMRSECDYFSDTDRSKIVDCPFPSVCAKYLVEASGVKLVHRRCHNYNVCTEVAKKYNDEVNTLIDCFTCSDRDLCNSSSSTQYSVIIIIALLGALSIFGKFGINT